MLFDSFVIFSKHINIILYVFILQSFFAIMVSWFLFNLRMDKESLIIISFIGGILGLVLFSLGVVIIKAELSNQFIPYILSLLILILVIKRKFFFVFFSTSFFIMVLFFLYIFLLRLFFIKSLIVPPYSDSIQHFLIIQDLINLDTANLSFFKLSFDLRYYYHFGFHAVIALLSQSTQTPVPQIIMVVGQYFQALAVLSVYVLSYAITKNKNAAVMSMCISGLYLTMPAYASNWGKYPAIASLSGLSFTVAILLFVIKNKKKSSPSIYLIIFLSTLSTILLHSRSAIVIALSSILIFLYMKFLHQTDKLYLHSNRFEAVISGIISLMLVSLLLSSNSLRIDVSLVFQFIFLFSIIFSLYKNFLYTFILILFISIVTMSVFLPIPFSDFFPFRFNSLLDRQFALIILYLPIAFILQNGVEGILKLFFKNSESLWRKKILGIVFLIGILNSYYLQNHNPSDCCNYINDDDLFAFEWMLNNISSDSIIGIAASGQTGRLLYADGGGWIEIITKIPTRKIDTKSDFAEIKKELCNDNIHYLYVEKFVNSFDEYNITQAGGTHQFNLGSINIYKLDCVDQ